ncbi:MAG: tryptophan transporter [Peptostreptococcaceae bacterium]
MRTNTRKLVLNSILLAMGLLLHQITPALGLPIQPDMALAMMFTIMIINKDDYKSCLLAGIVTGIFTALTTKFPGGQIPNVIDKVVTVNIVYFLMICMYNLPFIKKLNTKKQDTIVSAVILPIGTLISGSIFLLSALLLVGLPGSFTALFMVAVAPATIINLIAGMFLFKVVNLSINRGVVKI